jgi:hypothetical protein
MLGDRLDGDRKRLRQLVDGGLTLGEARKDRPPRWIGEGRKRARELVDGQL